jgi:sortase A
MKVSGTRALRTFAYLCIAIGDLCIAFFLYQEWSHRTAKEAALKDVYAMSDAHYAAMQSQPLLAHAVDLTRDPDQRSWSVTRSQQYRAALLSSRAAPLAALRIRQLGLEVPIFGDTTDASLDIGAGIIEGTSLPGAGGNMGIAAHRDGFFRELRNMALGVVAEVETPSHIFFYRIDRISVVDSNDARLLANTDEPSITLVTCYPFYFVGAAPRRFIAQGHLERSVATVRGAAR